jgi:hypothetical protein
MDLWRRSVSAWSPPLTLVRLLPEVHCRIPLTAQKIRLAVTIDRHVNQVVANGGGDEALLLSMSDHMGTFKQLLDTCSGEDMDHLCQQYDGFYRFATLLETLAQGIADGTIPVPPEG